jgi:hypothetical protein
MNLSRHVNGDARSARDRSRIAAVILVDEGSRRRVLARTDDAHPCHECESRQRVIAVRYQVFGFFNIFGAGWSRHYYVECRQCRAAASAISRSEFEKDLGNAIPYGHRYGLLVLGLLIAGTVLVLATVGRGPALGVALLIVWTVSAVGMWRNAWASSFTRRRKQLRAAEEP